MSTSADRYRRLSDRFREIVAAVPQDRWSSPSPCEDWTALDVTRHVVESHGLFEQLAGRPLDATPDVDADPVGAFDTVRAIVQADLDDPERAATSWDGHFGRTTFEDAIDRFVGLDLVVHGWDVAKATGGDTSIGAEDLDVLESAVVGFGEAARAPGVFRPELDVPADADQQTRVLALLGRRA